MLLLQALFHEARGEESEALSVIERAISLAEPGEFIRPFVDLGPKMADLLNRLGKQNIAVKYVGKLLSVFKKERADAIRTASDDQRERILSSSHPLLVETLSKREFDILNHKNPSRNSGFLSPLVFVS